MEVLGLKELQRDLRRMPTKYREQAVFRILRPAANALKKLTKQESERLDKGTGEGLLVKSVGVKRFRANLKSDFQGMFAGVRYNRKFDGKTLTSPAKAAIFSFGTVERKRGRVKGVGDFVDKVAKDNKPLIEARMARAIDRFTQKELNKI